VWAIGEDIQTSVERESTVNIELPVREKFACDDWGLECFETEILLLMLTNDDEAIVIVESLWDLMSEETMFTERGGKRWARERERQIQRQR
jgi:hypothetical protein